MKVEGPGNLRGNAPMRRTGKAEPSSGGAFTKQLVGETGSAASNVGAAGAAAPVGVVSGILAAQEVDDAAARESRGKARAKDMLDKMDEIRHALLAGALPREKLMDLARVVQTRKVAVDDPRLAEVLDEIDLRAQVEIAKLTS